MGKWGAGGTEEKKGRDGFLNGDRKKASADRRD